MGATLIGMILNSKEVTATDGERLVDVIRRHGISLPSPCYHKSLTETGHCGMCLIGARAKAVDGFTVVSACTATARDGVEIDTEFPEALCKRMELLSLCLLQHPLDCSKCDKVGLCFIHRLATRMKLRGFTRIANGKLCNVRYKNFGKNIIFDGQKCIGCKRCIRFCRDTLDDEVLGFLPTEGGCGEVAPYPGKELSGNYCLNLVDLCPAGALMDRNHIHQPQQWTLMRTESISIESSVGVNTYVLHSENRIFRIVPRENEHVNGPWIPDSARVEHKFFSDRKRLLKTMINGRKVSLRAAITHIVKAIFGHRISVVCSGSMSLEDQFVLRRFLEAAVSGAFCLRKSRTADGFLMSDDATPNFNGAILNSIAKGDSIVEDLSELNRSTVAGQCKLILSINEDIFSNGVSRAIPGDVEIFYVGNEENETARRASVVIPTATVFESTGTFINKDWRLQKFHKAINPPNASIFPPWYIFSLLLNAYFNAEENDLLWLDRVWLEMAKAIPQLVNIDFSNVDSSGILLKF
ncbi:MAG: (2Fe-2S)-binding protein [Puniceicoccales bacterium]|jgi:NADH-quinone oxidoreductase subunit G|nr:(2Fe-2S)-binding protein [Puniceicoccales bacterium]